MNLFMRHGVQVILSAACGLRLPDSNEESDPVLHECRSARLTSAFFIRLVAVPNRLLWVRRAPLRFRIFSECLMNSNGGLELE